MKRHALLTILLLLIGLTVRAAIGDGLPRLSPRPVVVDGVAAPVLTLNGTWEFRAGTTPAAKAAKIEVPGEWGMQGFDVAEGETAFYATTFDIPADWSGKRVKIRFDGVSSYGLVKVNGRTIGEHEGGMVPFEFDVTEALKSGSNRLEVEVKALTISDRMGCVSQYACHTVGGILRKVALVALPEVNIAGTDVTTTLDKSYKHAVLNVTTEIANEAGVAGRPIAVEYILKNAEGNRVATAKQAIDEKTAGGSVAAKLSVRNARLWNPEEPNLYTLTTRLLVAGRSVQENEQRVGLRQVEVRGNLLVVNGRPVKLHGVNRHEVHPLRGRSGTPELCRKDAELFKAGNCNYVRTSHYPPSEEFLDACDEIGLFVESEAAICWVQHGASPIWGNWDYRDERFLPYMLRASVDNILAGRRHPSVILWSVGNESYWSPLWQQVIDSAKRIDSSRPYVFHDQCWGGYNNGGGRADIANFHYADMNGPASCDTMSRPVLFGEYAHLSCYNRIESITDPSVRAAFSKPMVQYYDSMYYHPGCLGGALWSGIDDTFHLPDGRIVGYGPWGLIDAWRREKPEYTGMKRAYSPFRIVEQVRTPEGIELTVENRYNFLNFGRIKIEAGERGGKLAAIASRIPARSKGKIVVPARADEEVYLRVTDPQGYVCAEELFAAEQKSKPDAEKTAATVSEKASEPVKWTVEDRPDALTISGNGGGEKYTVIFSKTTGEMTRAAVDGKTLLSQGPAFCLVPMNANDGGKPNVAGETYQNEIYPDKYYAHSSLYATGFQCKQSEDGTLRVEVESTFRGGDTGKMVYLFGTDGEIRVDYEVVAGSKVDPRQYGIEFRLPVGMENLSWKRNGEFSIYSEHDIARTEGTARLNARQQYEVEAWREIPTGAWKDDANMQGSVDFRSTRPGITEAALIDAAGHGVRVCGDGKQAVRCWLQDGRIHMLVADYNNGGAERFYSSPFTEGRIAVKKGDVLRGTVRFRLE